MKYNWIVVSTGVVREKLIDPREHVETPDIQSGVVGTFDEAIRALGDWYGDGALPNRSYQIIPVPETEADWRSML